MSEGWRVLTHGGAGSRETLSDATAEAAERAGRLLSEGAEAIEAACEAVAMLEGDGRFNAGAGSRVRADGTTVQMDAACADSRGAFGAVACIERVPRPVRVARAVADTEHLVLAGEGARALARERGLDEGAGGERPADDGGQNRPDEDTVGCVVRDGNVFAAALSSGGTRDARVGRVGDVPLPGCGLRAGPAGAVAATGHGESIARARLADQVYRALATGRDADVVVAEATAGFEEVFHEASVGLIVANAEGGAGGSNRSMAFSRWP